MWRVQFDPKSKILAVELRAEVDTDALLELSVAYSRALECTADASFGALYDLRGLFPLDAPSLAALAEIKRMTADLVNCVAIATLADGGTVAMQQRRTRVTTVPELITSEEGEARAFLADKSAQHPAS